MSAALHTVVETMVKKMSDADMVKTEYPGHAKELAAEAARQGYQVVVAVGGDGTVNEVASALIGTDSALGIVPLGSGNGLARHLHIPLIPEKAVRNVRKSSPVTIDSCSINGKPFFCTAGIGYDAQVAADYANAGSRGLLTYAKEALHDWRMYEPRDYVIETEEGRIETKALLITFGNANQWGNDFFITPQASLQDGKIDIAIVKPAKLSSNIEMVMQLRVKKLTDNPDVQYIRTSFAEIEPQDGRIVAHYDGEVADINDRIRIECHPQTLHVIPGK